MDITPYFQMALDAPSAFISKDNTVDTSPTNISRGDLPSFAQQPESQPKTRQSSIANSKLGLQVSDLTAIQRPPSPLSGKQNQDGLLRVTLSAGKIDHAFFFKDARNVTDADFKGEMHFTFLVATELVEKIDINWQETDLFKIASGLGGQIAQTGQEATNSLLAATNDNIVNPFTRMKFAGVKPRDWGIQAYFYPKNQKESDMLSKQITMLKDAALPIASGIFLESPKVFKITFGSDGSVLNNIAQPGLCAITSIHLNYTPLEGKATFFENWRSKAMKLDISLAEITPIYFGKNSGGISSAKGFESAFVGSNIVQQATSTKTANSTPPTNTATPASTDTNVRH
jgi:hypothetical protein